LGTVYQRNLHGYWGGIVYMAGIYSIFHQPRVDRAQREKIVSLLSFPPANSEPAHPHAHVYEITAVDA
jgi:hypothetical protein